MTTIKELLDKYGRAVLGIDGNAGFALLGPDIQEGEADFVEIDETLPPLDGQRIAAKQALYKLRLRLDEPRLSYYFGPSHPHYS